MTVDELEQRAPVLPATVGCDQPAVVNGAAGLANNG